MIHLKKELIKYKNEKQEIVDQVKILNSKMRDIDREIQKLIDKQKEAENPTLSDHALVRYLERAKGFDLNVFREEVLTKENISAINAGAQTIKVNGVKFKVSGKVIVTTI